MQCNDVEHAIEESGSLELPEAAQAHVAGCASCTALIADFQAILTAAREIPAEVEPPPRVWVALHAQLEAEGIIRQPRALVQEDQARWWPRFAQLTRGRMLATATFAALILAVGV